MVDAPAPFRIAFDNARDPYTARNALGITGSGGGVTSATPPLSITAGVLSIDLSGYQPPPQGRLTLTTATPVMTSTQAAKTTIFYTPYVGNKLPIYDGTVMVMTTFAELSNVTTASSTGSAGPAAVAASSVYDLFVWSNAGTVTLTRGPAWTSGTARSAGTALVMVAGVLLNNVSITNGPAASRGTYVGTVRSNASSQLDWILGGSSAGGTAAIFGVWNAYNRRPVATQIIDTTASFTVAASGVASLNAAVGNRVTIVAGLQEDFHEAMINYTGQAGASSNCGVGIGYNSLTAFSGVTAVSGFSGPAPVTGLYAVQPFGVNFFQGLQIAQGPSNCLIYGNAGAPLFIQGGMTFRGFF